VGKSRACSFQKIACILIRVFGCVSVFGKVMVFVYGNCS